MLQQADSLETQILKIIVSSKEPLETKEIEQRFKGTDSTRTKILIRLNYLRGDGKIFGKRIGSGKGAWIWWKR